MDADTILYRLLVPAFEIILLTIKWSSDLLNNLSVELAKKSSLVTKSELFLMMCVVMCVCLFLIILPGRLMICFTAVSPVAVYTLCVCACV